MTRERHVVSLLAKGRSMKEKSVLQSIFCDFSHKATFIRFRQKIMKLFSCLDVLGNLWIALKSAYMSQLVLSSIICFSYMSHKFLPDHLMFLVS